ncbi:NmrA family NAD(P)-binding protein (plasmid) [Rhodococcus opacus]|uniref:NmrA family NAD(P)-binding protein n=1 Tax=Rhodococcus opacus TaxID=37919 RepID=A0AAX3YU54_RHOOP|nr:NmrA family NAD(P)-binding protein [Rhodococcus opacus]MCZ4590114.1 NmrA family NAD(P)-binding protein [Rhodococcus opacus]WKN61187.1 NmrA family NAD(P)-binding protein [Rhodococcus opacus]WLF51652.1 NmrA family NAD(P)-binding protein [Rhodococcus opacus]WLF52551.1 NmrA family NAD(P)-binding protein [Rhodococcus opacus]
MSSNTSQPTVLVIGATGRHGRTGARVVEQLINHNRAVRVLIRSDDDRATQLRQLGAQTVVGDLHDRRTLIPAVEDVESVYFTYPIAAGIVPAAANLASAIRQVGITPHVVVMSMGPSTADSPSELGRAQWSAEEILAWAGLNPTVLRVAGLFYENISTLHAESIRANDYFANSFGDAPAPWISGQDAADIGVTALLHPERFAESPISFLPAAELHSHATIAAMISKIVDREISYQHISREQWQAALEHAATRGHSTINLAMAQHISTIGAGLANAGANSHRTANPTAVQDLIGRTPMTLEQFLTENSAQFVS